MKKIAASSLAEMVIALSIISICLTIASRVFVQANRSSIQFKEVKIQTEFINLMHQALRSDTLPNLRKWQNEEWEIKMEDPDRSRPYRKAYVMPSGEKELWNQEFQNP